MLRTSLTNSIIKPPEIKIVRVKLWFFAVWRSETPNEGPFVSTFSQALALFS